MTYVSVTEAAEVLGVEPYEVEAEIASNHLDPREHDGITYVSRVSLDRLRAEWHWAELKKLGVR